MVISRPLITNQLSINIKYMRHLRIKLSPDLCIGYLSTFLRVPNRIFRGYLVITYDKFSSRMDEGHVLDKLPVEVSIALDILERVKTEVDNNKASIETDVKQEDKESDHNSREEEIKVLKRLSKSRQEEDKVSKGGETLKMVGSATSGKEEPEKTWHLLLKCCGIGIIAVVVTYGILGLVIFQVTKTKSIDKNSN